MAETSTFPSPDAIEMHFPAIIDDVDEVEEEEVPLTRKLHEPSIS